MEGHIAGARARTLQRIRVAERARRKRIAVTSVTYLLLTVVALIAIVPFLWMVSTSLKTASEASTYPPSLVPAMPQWHDFTDVFSAVPFLTFFRNTVLYSTLVTLGQLLFCSTAAFAFARLAFPGRNT